MVMRDTREKEGRNSTLLEVVLEQVVFQSVLHDDEVVVVGIVHAHDGLLLAGDEEIVHAPDVGVVHVAGGRRGFARTR